MTNSLIKDTDRQHKKLILCAIIMAVYLIIILLIEPRSFWILSSVHTVLTTGIILLIWFGAAHKSITRIGLPLGAIGAATALILMLYYFAIVISLANR